MTTENKPCPWCGGEATVYEAWGTVSASKVATCKNKHCQTDGLASYAVPLAIWNAPRPGYNARREGWEAGRDAAAVSAEECGSGRFCNKECPYYATVSAGKCSGARIRALQYPGEG